MFYLKHYIEITPNVAYGKIVIPFNHEWNYIWAETYYCSVVLKFDHPAEPLGELADFHS